MKLRWGKNQYRLATGSVVLALVLALTVQHAWAADYRILYFGHDPGRETDVATIDILNGERKVMQTEIGFLLRSPDEGKYFDANKLPLDLLIIGFRFEKPSDLNISIIGCEPGLADITLGDIDDNWGVAIACAVEIEAPPDLPPGTREANISFPALMVLKEKLGAITPTQEPRITFIIRNFANREALASALWWRNLLFGFLCLVGLGIAIVIFAMGDEGAFVGIIGAVVAILGAFYFFGISLEQLTWVNPLMPWVVFGFVNILFAKGLLYTGEKDIGYIAFVVALFVVAVSWLLFYLGWHAQDFQHIAWGAIVLLPGFAMCALSDRWKRVR